MPLPKINTPTYELVIPSSKKKVKYRPFLVREEKILVMALESEDMTQITNAVVDTITNCIQTRGVKVSDLSTFDIEYIFLNIRSKSVGETIEVNITCPDDGETQAQVSINVDDIKIQTDKNHTNIINLDDNLKMRLKYPALEQFIESNFEYNTDESEVDKSLDVIISCVDIIYNEEESWAASDSSKKELKEFIEQMNTKQFKEIETFFATMPKLSHKIKVKNPKTGVVNDVILEGLASFFS
tara:strand:- start:967 stop:1689 length:723 start_codon:yes stop_codon:yes gene_type:complete